MIRIDSYLSKYGISSRRKVKEFIQKGRIAVGSKIITDVVRIDPSKEEVYVDGMLIKSKLLNFEYILLNKPLNVLSTTHDDFGRKTVLDLIKSKNRLYPVGRLDSNSTGLILLTNDGEVALKLTHPRYQIPKKYLVTTKESLLPSQLEKLRNGVTIYEQKTSPAKVQKVDQNTFEIEITQGLKRQIRLMCKEVGLNVISLQRTCMASLSLGTLRLGESRDISKQELITLFSYLKISR